MAFSDKFIEALFDEQERNAKLSISLSALILALNYVHITVEKISIGGAEVAIKDPTVIIGALGIVLLYSVLISARFIFTFSPLIKRIDPEFSEVVAESSTFCSIACSWLLLVVQVVLPILALFVALPSAVKVISLV